MANKYNIIKNITVINFNMYFHKLIIDYGGNEGIMSGLYFENITFVHNNALFYLIIGLL